MGFFHKKTRPPFYIINLYSPGNDCTIWLLVCTSKKQAKKVPNILNKYVQSNNCLYGIVSISHIKFIYVYNKPSLDAVDWGESYTSSLSCFLTITYYLCKCTFFFPHREILANAPFLYAIPIKKKSVIWGQWYLACSMISSVFFAGNGKFNCVGIYEKNS